MRNGKGEMRNEAQGNENETGRNSRWSGVTRQKVWFECIGVSWPRRAEEKNTPVPRTTSVGHPAEKCEKGESQVKGRKQTNRGEQIGKQPELRAGPAALWDGAQHPQLAKQWSTRM